MRKLFISKADCDKRINEYKFKLKRKEELYEKMSQEKKIVSKQNGEYNYELKQLKIEIERLRREKDDLEQSKKDLIGIMESMKVEIEKLKNEVCQDAGCNDCIALRQEKMSDKFLALIKHKVHKMCKLF